MAKFKKRRKMGKFGRILAFVLCGALLIGALGSVVAFAHNDTKAVNSYEFSVGALSEENGQYVEDKTAIYTKDAIECQGLSIKPEFDSNVTFQIFWYNEDEVYFGCTERTTMPSARFIGDVPYLAKYCRIVIYPSQLDEEGKQIKDFEVKLYEIRSIAKNLNITVDKKQEFEVNNLLETSKVYDSSMGTKSEIVLNGQTILFENTNASNFKVNINEVVFTEDERYDMLTLDASSVSMYKIDMSHTSTAVKILMYDSSGNFVDQNWIYSGVNYVNIPTDEDVCILSLLIADDNLVVTPYLPRY